MNFYIKCRKCNTVNEIKKTNEIAKHVHHLECNWCPKCNPSANDYYEEFTCNEHGEAIDDGWK